MLISCTNSSKFPEHPLLQVPMQIIREEDAARSLGLRSGPAGVAAAKADAPQDRFQELCPGQRVTVELPLHEIDAPGSGGQSRPSSGLSQAKNKGRETGRFSATVLDVEGPLAKSAAQECAVFLVPQVS